MLKKLTRKLSRKWFQVFIGMVYAVTLLTMSGLTDLARAASTCDTSKFEGFFQSYDGKSTYAVTKNALPWSDAHALAKSADAKLATIRSEEENADIFEHLSQYFTAAPAPSSSETKAWIGLYDPANTTVWSREGEQATVVPSRFSWADGFSSFANWKEGQPDGYCSNAERSIDPDGNCYGEPWAAITSGGKWTDEGDHGTTPLALKGVVEWQNEVLDCVKPVTPPETVRVDTLEGSWCTNSLQSSLQECNPTVDGGQLCPLDRVACNADRIPPICPAGSVLETGRDMCQANPIVTCGSGYTYDESIDRCVKDPLCPEGGVFSSARDRCEKLVMNECPVGYSYDSGQDICHKSVDCGSGAVFVAGRDRCEKPPIWDCPSGYAYNSSVAKCEVSPYCPSGTAYDTTRKRCEAAPGTCPAGYTYNTVLDKCVSSVTCSSGGALNGTTDKCEIVASTSCSAGWSYNAGTGKCEQNPACASPGAYNATYDLCLATSTGISCPSGYTYSSTYGTCVASPVCVGGSYNAANNRCESTATYSCSDPSYSYNSGTGRCEKAPVCSQGTYSTTYNKCLLSFTKNCPSGYSYNSARDRCEFQPPQCSQGTYNPATNKCEWTTQSSYAATGTTTGGVNYSVKIVRSGSIQFSTCMLDGYLGFSGCGATFGYLASSSFPGSVAVYKTGNVMGSCIADGNIGLSGCGGIAGYMSPVSFPGAVATYQTGNMIGGYCYASAKLGTSGCGGVVGYMAPTPGVYGSTTTYSCNAGDTLVGTTCYHNTLNQVNPTCPNGSLDGTNDLCYAPYTPACPGGMTYDSSANMCAMAAACANGLLDSGADKCYQGATSGCPSGYSLSGSICIKTPACNTPGTYDSSKDLCSYVATYNCPAGYSYSGTYGQCYKTADCGSGSLSTSLDKCQMAYSLTCPGGYSLSGTTCQVAPDCSSGGTYSTTLNMCDGGSNVCTSPLLLDTAVDKCWQATSCAGGTLNTARDKCEASATVNCGAWTWDSTSAACHSAPVCANGSYNATSNECRAVITRNCGSYGWDQTDSTCVTSVPCPVDINYVLKQTVGYSGELDKCVSDAHHQCSNGMTFMGLPVNKCEAIPVCNAGSYNTEQNSCMGTFTCPAGDNVCKELVGDTTEVVPGIRATYCSPNSCQSDTSGWVAVDDTESGINDKKNDGEKDADGNCLGQIYLLNGNDMRCRVYDSWGMVNSYAKLVASIVLACTGIGATLAAAMAVTGSVGVAVVNAAVQLAVNAVIDAATGQPQASLLSVGTTLIAAGVGAYMSGAPNPDVGGISSANASLMNEAATSAAQNGISVGSLLGDTGGFTFISAASNSYGGAFLTQAQQVASQSTFTTFMNQVTDLASEYKDYIGVAQGGMLGNYSQTRCCYPDKLSAACKPEEIKEANQAANGMCHIVGTYCASKMLFACMVKKRTSCCFGSRLARIIHEQGRPQLVNFKNNVWGSAKSPNCRGFTPTEFQSLDFSQMDLTEFTEDIAKRMNKLSPVLDGYIQQVGQQVQSSISASPSAIFGGGDL